MVWAKLDDLFCEHPKVAPLSDAAFRLHVTALVWCCRYLTDGIVAAGAIGILYPDPFQERPPLPKVIDELVSSGLWKKRPKGDYELHDFLAYNKSAEQVKTTRDAAARRQANWRGKGEEHNAVTNIVGNAVTDVSHNAVSNTAPDPDPDPDPGEKREKRGDRGEKRRWTRRPLTAQLSTGRLNAALRIGLTETQACDEWAAMGDCEYKTPKRDVDATWRTWCRNAVKWSGNKGIEAQTARLGEHKRPVTEAQVEALRQQRIRLGVKPTNGGGPNYQAWCRQYVDGSDFKDTPAAVADYERFCLERKQAEIEATP